MAVLTCRIGAVLRETPRNRLVRLALDGREFPFEAGQYVLLGDHGRPDRRPYSIACAPHQARQTGMLEFLIQVDHSDSPGAHLARLSPGLAVDVEGPAGTFVLPAGGRGTPAVFVGGGTGIAPLRSMLWEKLAETPPSRVALLQSARAPQELSFSGEFRHLAALGRIRLVETVTRSSPASWSGARGRIGSGHLARLLEGRRETLCYVCGPDSLVEDVPRLLRELGIDADCIRTEHWSDQTP
jgi:NAD(P)H-flavin reductase